MAAARKPTTTEDLTAEATDPTPTHEDRVADIEAATDPEVVADVKQPKTVKVESPTGFVTEVPSALVDALKDSGYKVKK